MRTATSPELLTEQPRPIVAKSVSFERSWEYSTLPAPSQSESSKILVPVGFCLSSTRHPPFLLTRCLDRSSSRATEPFKRRGVCNNRPDKLRGSTKRRVPAMTAPTPTGPLGWGKRFSRPVGKMETLGSEKPTRLEKAILTLATTTTMKPEPGVDTVPRKPRLWRRAKSWLASHLPVPCTGHASLSSFLSQPGSIVTPNPPPANAQVSVDYFHVKNSNLIVNPYPHSESNPSVFTCCSGM